MSTDLLMWVVGAAIMLIRWKLGKNKLLKKASKGGFDWMKFVQWVLLLFGVWTLFTAPIPFLPEGWQSVGEIIASVGTGMLSGLLGWLGAAGADAAAAVAFSIVFGLLLFFTILDMLDLDPEHAAVAIVWAAVPLAYASVGWIAATFTSAITWVSMAGPNAMINAVI